MQDRSDPQSRDVRVTSKSIQLPQKEYKATSTCFDCGQGCAAVGQLCDGDVRWGAALCGSFVGFLPLCAGITAGSILDCATCCHFKLDKNSTCLPNFVKDKIGENVPSVPGCMLTWALVVGAPALGAGALVGGTLGLTKATLYSPFVFFKSACQQRENSPEEQSMSESSYTDSSFFDSDSESTSTACSP